MIRGLPRLSLVFLLLIWSSQIDAHSGSASYVHITDFGNQVSLSVSLDMRDVEYAIGLDSNVNGEITWGELLGQRSALQAYVLHRLQLQRDQRACPVALGELAVEEINGNMYAVVAGKAECVGREALQLKSDMMFDLDTTHRSLVEWKHRERTTLSVLTTDQRQSRSASQGGLLAQLSNFAAEGMLHIWSGFDHLAFLLVLLLPAFVSAGRASIAWGRLVAIISSFTVAHSITLAVAISGVVSVPTRPVEIAIAASVTVAALTNLFPRTQSIGAATAFAFGLLHGFGFASALGGLGATTESSAMALLGFNLGVEAGQLLVVAASLPFALWIRKYPAYATRFVPIGSLCVALLGSLWVCQRIVS